MNCTHRAIRSWSQLDGSPVEMWSCVDCGWRFEPLIDKKEASNSTEPVAWLLEAFNIDEHKTLKRVVFDKPNVSPGVKVTPYYTHQPERQPLTLEIHQPNESGSTLVTARWFVDTPHGWIGAWDREALEYILKGKE